MLNKKVFSCVSLVVFFLTQVNSLNGVLASGEVSSISVVGRNERSNRDKIITASRIGAGAALVACSVLALSQLARLAVSSAMFPGAKGANAPKVCFPQGASPLYVNIDSEDGGKILGCILKNPILNSSEDTTKKPFYGHTIVCFLGQNDSSLNIYGHKELIEFLFNSGASEIFTTDIRGYGQSTFEGCKPGAFQASKINEGTIKSDIQNMVDFLSYNSVPPLWVFGHSLGGYHASVFAKEWLKKTGKKCALILFSPLTSLKVSVRKFSENLIGGAAGSVAEFVLSPFLPNGEFDTVKNCKEAEPYPLIVVSGDKVSDWLSTEGTEMETYARDHGEFICVQGCHHSGIKEMLNAIQPSLISKPMDQPNRM
ncbi:MAG: lysophospholipase [Oscillospiraceae bacterium]|nr:lysophospholipase [Oscillospiraceae bacterium]